MPWKDIRPMDHRHEFVLAALRRDIPFAQLCRQHDVSAKTGYKWLARFQQGGLPALHDQSTRPRSSPQGLDEDAVCRIVELKTAHPHWGPRKIRALHARVHPAHELPSESTFKRVLDKAGMVAKRPAARASAACGRIQERRAAAAPNDVWTVDFKGWWRACGGARCEPLTIRDAHSRFILCADPLDGSSTPHVRARFERAFEAFGLPAAIRSDNGPPFASPNGLLGLTRLSAWWLALGISLDRIDPGCPGQNGAHERMHRDISLEIEAAARGDIAHQRAALEEWRVEYNTLRPHQALGYRVPADLYKPSQQRFEGTPGEIAYPADQAPRRVRRSGVINVGRSHVFISQALAGWHVGLSQEGEDAVGVWFCGLRVGTLNERLLSFEPADKASGLAP